MSIGSISAEFAEQPNFFIRTGVSVLSDVGSNVARKFGLVFTLDETLRPIYKAFGIDLVAHNGVDGWELPIPATYVVAKSGKILSAFVDVDYRNRAEPAEILESLERA
jgi:peroxiredoxin